MANNYKAIDALCDILDRSSSEQKYNFIAYACSSVGIPMEPTGLKPTKGRKLKDLHWDYTLDDLRKKLIQLVDEVGLLEQVAVEGVLAFLISFYRRLADPNKTPRIYQKHLDMIEDLEGQLCLSVSERSENMSDEELTDLITKIKDLSIGCGARQQGAQEALHFLQREAKDVFTDEFWD